MGLFVLPEQSVIVVDSIYKQVRERFATHGGYMLTGKGELKSVFKILS